MTDTDRPDRDRLDEVVSEALHQHVDAVTADATLLDRIRTSMTADVPASGYVGRRRGWLLASAAAVVVAVAAAGMLLAMGGDEEGVVTDGVADDGGGGTEPPPTTTTAPEPTVGEGAVAAALPDRAVLARTRPDGSTARLVLVDLTDGTELATLDTIDNRPCEDEGIAACYVSYAHTTVSAGTELFVERCCEPAGGNVDRHPGLDPDTGALADGQPYLAGYFPTVDPTGTRVAAAGQTAITIRDIDSDGPGHQIELLEPGQATGETYPTGLAWAPDGRALAVSLAGPDGGRIVTVPADADSLADGSVLTSGEPQAVQAWTDNGRVWVLDAASGSVASPVRAIDIEDATTTTFEVLARQVVADRTGTYLYVVTVDGLRRADRNATTSDRLVTSDTILVPAAGDVLGAVSVFDAHTCTAAGEATVDVPSVVGRELADARRMLEAVGLTVVDDGVPAGDDTPDTAVVTAQEPPAGSRVPAGACVGMRTRDR